MGAGDSSCLALGVCLGGQSHLLGSRMQLRHCMKVMLVLQGTYQAHLLQRGT
jgi:hypothetical protein